MVLGRLYSLLEHMRNETIRNCHTKDIVGWVRPRSQWKNYVL